MQFYVIRRCKQRDDEMQSIAVLHNNQLAWFLPLLDAASVFSRAFIFNQGFRRLPRNFFRDIGFSEFLLPSSLVNMANGFNVRRAFIECADFPVRVYGRVRTWNSEVNLMGSLLLPRGIINDGSCKCAPLDN